MPQFGGKDSKRHFTVVMGGKEHGLYVSSTPSSAAKKAVTKLCAANKSKKVEFHIREITQGSKKKTYGPYSGYIEKLKEPIELKGRVIKYKPVAKLSGKSGAKKGGMRGGTGLVIVLEIENLDIPNLQKLMKDTSFREGINKLNFTGNSMVPELKIDTADGELKFFGYCVGNGRYKDDFKNLEITETEKYLKGVRILQVLLFKYKSEKPALPASFSIYISKNHSDNYKPIDSSKIKKYTALLYESNLTNRDRIYYNNNNDNEPRSKPLPFPPMPGDGH